MQVRRAVVRSLGVVLLPVAALTLSGCGDDGAQTWVTGTPAPTTSTTTTSTTTTTEAPQDAEQVSFVARLSESAGAPWVEIEITSDAPDGAESWAVRVNGRLSARASASDGDRFGFRVGDVDDDDPLEVTVAAEGANRQVIAESAPVVLTR